MRAGPTRPDCDEPITTPPGSRGREAGGRETAATVDSVPVGGVHGGGGRGPRAPPPGHSSPQEAPNGAQSSRRGGAVVGSDPGGRTDGRGRLGAQRQRGRRVGVPAGARPRGPLRRGLLRERGSRTTPSGWPSSSPRASSSGATSARAAPWTSAARRASSSSAIDWQDERFGMEISQYARAIAVEAGVRFDRDIFSESDFFDLVIIRGTIQHLDEPFLFLKHAFTAPAARRLRGLPGDAQHQLALLPPQEDAAVHRPRRATSTSPTTSAWPRR